MPIKKYKTELKYTHFENCITGLLKGVSNKDKINYLIDLINFKNKNIEKWELEKQQKNKVKGMN